MFVGYKHVIPSVNSIQDISDVNISLLNKYSVQSVTLLRHIFHSIGLEKLEGDQIVLEADETVIDDDDVVMALDKNTVLMVLKDNEIWKPEALMSTNASTQPKMTVKLDGQSNIPVTKGTTSSGSSMRLEICDGKLILRNPTEDVSMFIIFLV